jgi:hypothetical protein
MSTSSLLDIFPSLSYRDINVIPISARFQAILGAVVPLYFTWPYSSSLAFVATAGYGYYFDFYSIGADLDESKFSDGIVPSYNAQGFSLDIIPAQADKPINQSPINFSTFLNVSPLGMTYKASLGTGTGTLNSQQVNLRLRGQIVQTNDIIVTGKTDINIIVSMMVYEISNKKFVQDWFK